MCRQLLLFVLRSHHAGTLPLLKRRLETKVDIQRSLGLFVTAHANLFLYALYTRFYRLQILQLQFSIDHLLVAHRIHRPVHMYYVVVVETAQHMDDCVRLADIGKELVAETFAAAGAFHEAGNVHYFNSRRDDATLGFAQFA